MSSLQHRTNQDDESGNFQIQIDHRIVAVWRKDRGKMRFKDVYLRSTADTEERCRTLFWENFIQYIKISNKMFFWRAKPYIKEWKDFETGRTYYEMKARLNESEESVVDSEHFLTVNEMNP